MSLYLMPVGEGRRIPIRKTVVFIGRHPDCDVVLSRSLKVSRRHCCLALVDNKLMIRDLGSTNGVHVNGQRIKREEVLRLGDEIVVGDVPFILKSRGQNEPLFGDDETQAPGAQRTGNNRAASRQLTPTDLQPEEMPERLDEKGSKVDDPLQVQLNDGGADEARLTPAPPNSADLDTGEKRGDLRERSIYELNDDEVPDESRKFHPEDSSIFK